MVILLPPMSASPQQQTWLIVGASRGIGLQYCRSLLLLGHRVLATARSIASANQLYSLTGGVNGRNLNILECDVCDENSIIGLKESLRRMGRGVGMGTARLERLDVVVLNAGVLLYPNRISEISFNNFAQHLHTNTIGPLVCASALLSLASPESQSSPMMSNSPYAVGPTTPSSVSSYSSSSASTLSPTIPIGTLVFTSSDSGSTTNFRAFEDGFGAYAASKAALNQGLRHLAAELYRSNTAMGHPQTTPVVLAIHPGEVQTDMADISLDWEVEGIISPEESVSKMLRVIDRKGKLGPEANSKEATFWDWEGRRYPW